MQSQTVHDWRWSIMRCNLLSLYAPGETSMWQRHSGLGDYSPCPLSTYRQELFVLPQVSQMDIMGRERNGCRWLCYQYAPYETLRSDNITPVCASRGFLVFSLLFPLPSDVLLRMTFTSRTQGTRTTRIYLCIFVILRDWRATQIFLDFC